MITARYTPVENKKVTTKGLFGTTKEKWVESNGEPKRIRIVGFTSYKTGEIQYSDFAFYIKDDGKLSLADVKRLDEVREE